MIFLIWHRQTGASVWLFNDKVCLLFYRDRANSFPAAGAEVFLLSGRNVQQDELVTRYKDQSSIIQQLQVRPAPTVITKGVTECGMN